MTDFYSAWLERSKTNQAKVDAAPRVTRSKDLKWMRTPQDCKAALMIAPELGFPTGGSCLMRAEIPVKYQTAGGDWSTIFYARFSDWKGKRRISLWDPI
jgi:hypothetical protein